MVLWPTFNTLKYLEIVQTMFWIFYRRVENVMDICIVQLIE